MLLVNIVTVPFLSCHKWFSSDRLFFFPTSYFTMRLVTLEWQASEHLRVLRALKNWLFIFLSKMWCHCKKKKQCDKSVVSPIVNPHIAKGCSSNFVRNFHCYVSIQKIQKVKTTLLYRVWLTCIIATIRQSLYLGLLSYNMIVKQHYIFQ